AARRAGAAPCPDPVGRRRRASLRRHWAGRDAEADPRPRGARRDASQVPRREVTNRLRRWLCAAGSRHDRLRDPDAVIRILDVRPGMAVGDLGPGAGHFTLRLARAVEPHGVVYALDTNR